MQPELFGGSAAYERFMGKWSRRLATSLVTFAGVRDGESVLDVGSGTGALAMAVRQAALSAQVTGIDPSAASVAYARSHASDDRMRFVAGDAQQMPWSDHTFNRTVSLLVMNFIPDPAKALREMIRVTRPGGSVAAAVWDYGEGMQMLCLFWDEAVALAPTAEARDERHMPLCAPGQLAALWRAEGLTQVEEQALTIPMLFASFDEYWSPFLGGQGPAGAYVAGLSDGERSALRLGLRRRLLGDGPDRSFTLQARAWAVKGVAGASEAQGRVQDDLFQLERFVHAQAQTYGQALAEVRAGRKRSHWMWYVFPQVKALGSSAMSRHYGIGSAAEAEAYLRHPVLGARLVECMEATLGNRARSARDIFGAPDDMKLRSCATLFAAVSPVGSVFERVLETFFDGERDHRTLALLDAPGH